MRRYQVDQLAGRDNLRLFPKLREVPLVAGNQVIGTPGIGTFDEYVVARVGRDLKRAGRFHEISPLLDQIDELPLNALSDAEFRTCQDILVFRQDGSRYVQPRGSGEASRRTVRCKPSGFNAAETTTLVSITNRRGSISASLFEFATP
jgi:hypothetical protein